MRSTIVIAALACLGCNQSDATPSKDPAPQEPAAAKPGAAAPSPLQQRPAKDKPKGPFKQSSHPAMKDPSKATDKAPVAFQVKMDTTVGVIELDCTRAWAPHGADRFYNLVKIGFFDDVAFFRVVPDFVVQFGIHGDPEVSKIWQQAYVEPDEVKESNKSGYLVFAQAGPPAAKGKTAKARSTQLFLNLKDNERLDDMGFAPLCKIGDESMKVLKQIHSGYGEQAGRDQASIQLKGNEYLRERYPKLDYIKTARLVEANQK